MLCVLVPEVEGAVAACCAEGAMHGVKGNGIYRVDIWDITGVWWGLPVASEGEVEAAHGLAEKRRTKVGRTEEVDFKEVKGSLPAIFIIHVLNRAAALNTTNSKSSCIAKAADHTGLPFQRALHGFVEFGRFI